MKNSSDLEISDLEMEIELEMDDSVAPEQGSEGEWGEGEMDFEGAMEDLEESDHAPDQESDFEIDDESVFEVEEETDEEADFESGFDGDFAQGVTEEFAQRFYELSTRDFEDESDLDREIGGLLNEMERRYFWGGVKGLLKKGLKYGAKGLLDKAMKYGQGLPGFKGVTQLARGNLKGALSSLAKQGLSAALRMNPVTSAGLTALQGLGFKPLGEAEANRQAWNNYTAVVREAYDHLAENLNDLSDQPLEASRQAANAFQSALQNVQSQKPAAGASRKRKVHRIRVRPGQKIRLIIEGIS